MLIDWKIHKYPAHRTTANKHNQESLYSAGGAHHPGETDEEDDSEDVLDAGQVDADERAHARGRRGLGVRVAGGGGRDRVRVVRQRAEERCRSGPILQLFLLRAKLICYD